MVRAALLGDGATNGATVSAPNSGRKAGVPVDSVSIGASATLTYDTSKAFFGTASIAVTTPGTGTTSYARFDSMYRPASGAAQALTIWLYFAANPAATMDVAFVGDVTTNRILQIRVTNTGKVRVYDQGNLAIVTMSTSIVLNQWVRVDVLFTPSAAAGVVQAKLYNTPGSSTPTEATSVFTSQALRTTDVGTVYLGVQGNVANAAYWLHGYISDAGAAPFGGGWVMSRWVGAATSSGVTVNARVLAASAVRLKVSTTSDLATSPVFSGSVAPDSDGVVSLSVSGLNPNAQYYYGFEVDGSIDSPMNGRFRTFPAAGQPTSFGFAAASCATINSNHPTYDTIRTTVGADGKSALFFGHLGDAHYRDISSNDPTLFHTAYDQVMSSSRQLQLFGDLAVPYTWSDHDSGGPNCDRTAVSLPACQAAYRSRIPHHAFGTADGAGIYQTFAAGRVLFIVTDGRSYMDPAAQANNASKTKLGTVQLAWLLTQLARTDFPVKIWLHEDAWRNGPNYSGDDSWNVFTTEANAIAAAARGVNLAYIAGDLHMVGADTGASTGDGFPVHQCGPMRGSSFVGHGTYNSGGPVPAADGTTCEQFGWFDVADTDNGHITLTYTGYNSAGTALVTQTTTWQLPSTTAIPVAIDKDGTAPVFQPAAIGDRVVGAGNGIYITVHNASGAAVTLTITPPGTTSYNVAKPPKVITIPAGGEKDIPVHREYADSAGLVTLGWSATPLVTWAARRTTKTA